MKRLGCAAATLLLMCRIAAAQQDFHRTIIPLCGKVTVRQKGKKRAAKHDLLQLYQTEHGNVQCCEQANLILETTTDRGGNFLVKKLHEGNYFIVFTDAGQQFTIPVKVPGSYEAKVCDVTQHFEIDADTGKSEVTVTIEVD